MDILIVSQYTAPGTNNRFAEVARQLVTLGHSVELATSIFWHKEKRFHRPEEISQEPYAVSFHSEPGYNSNVSLRRIRSHCRLAGNIRRYLRRRQVPDVILCAVPSLSVALVVLRYGQKCGARIVFDVQDLWPEAFELVARPTALARVLLMPLRWSADRVYCGGDSVVTVSDTYSRRVASVREDRLATTVYIGTKMEDFADLDEALAERPEDRFVLAYIGTLGHSYDVGRVIEALARIRRHDCAIPVRLLVMGDGPERQSLEVQARTLGVEAEFTGNLSHSEMAWRLMRANAAVNPIRCGAAQSLTNKIADYAAAGLPVVNTQESQEYRSLLRQYQAGISVDCGEVEKIADAIADLASDPASAKRLGHGSRRMAEDLFDRAEAYGVLTKMVTQR